MFGRKPTATVLVASLAGVGLLGGCRGEASTDPSDIPAAAFAANIRVQAGDRQTGPVMRPLPQALTVRVVDAGGQPVAGASVHWAVLDGGGTVNPPTGLSNAQGLVTTGWTLGTALGAQRVRASLTRGFLVDSVTFTATATVGAPTMLVFDAATRPPETAMVATSVGGMRYQVRDSLGNPVAGALVNFVPTAGSGSIIPASAVSNADGFVQVEQWTLPELVGVRSFAAQLVGRPALPPHFVVTTPDTSRRMTRVSGDAQDIAVADTAGTPMVVRVRDRFGNLTVGDTITWSVVSGGGSIVPPRLVTDANGEAQAVRAVGTTAGVVARSRAFVARAGIRDSLDFTANVVNGLPTVFQVDSATLPPATLRVRSAAENVRFVVRDKFGLPVPNVPVQFSGTGPAAVLVSPAQAVTDATGAVRVAWGVDSLVGTYNFVATVNRPTLQASFQRSIVATADTSRVVTLVSPDSVPLGSGLPGAQWSHVVSVHISDRFGNRIVGVPVNFADSLSTGSTVSPTTVATNAAGEASTVVTVRVSEDLGPALFTVRLAAAGLQRRVRYSASAYMPFRDVYAGNYYACGIGINDRAYCWGFGQDGQLGNGALLNTNRPAVAVRTSTGAFVTFRELSGGQSHTCGIGVARSLYCWGFEAEGRLFPPSAGTPVRVSTAAESPLAVVASVRSVSAGETHTCAVNVGGILYCSGANDRGQLGTGGTASGAIAARVDGTAGRPTIWSVVAAGERHSCGMPRFSPADSAPPPARPSQRVWCWGANDFGQLGSGFAGDSLAPVLVALPALRVGEDQPAGFDSTSLVAGAAHTCAIEVNGQRRAFCWGSNTFGQVGVGLADTLAFNNPRVVRLSTGEPVAGFVRLYAGEHHTCGILDGGGVRCWGRNQRGQLTGVSSAPLFQPTVITLPSMRALALGELFTCGIEGVPGSPGTTAPLGIVQCWGDNEFGQLGRGTFSPSGHSPLPPGQITSQRIGQ